MQHVKVLIYVLAAVTKCSQHARLEVATFTTPRLHPACIQAIKTCVEYPHHQIITLSFLDPATPTLGAPTDSACSTNLIDLSVAAQPSTQPDGRRPLDSARLPYPRALLSDFSHGLRFSIAFRRAVPDGTSGERPEIDIRKRLGTSVSCLRSAFWVVWFGVQSGTSGRSRAMRPEPQGSWDPELLAVVAASSKMRREMDWEAKVKAQMNVSCLPLASTKSCWLPEVWLDLTCVGPGWGSEASSPGTGDFWRGRFGAGRRGLSGSAGEQPHLPHRLEIGDFGAESNGECI
ncbi:hypothetical protein BGZ57DRAFT_851111 [Hyaloscypha finlandica]|nr:hypothetical protein BGZ57DRAFT_851111 [Hyaloscypha finlandica]